MTALVRAASASRNGSGTLCRDFAGLLHQCVLAFGRAEFPAMTAYRLMSYDAPRAIGALEVPLPNPRLVDPRHPAAPGRSATLAAGRVADPQGAHRSGNPAGSHPVGRSKVWCGVHNGRSSSRRSEPIASHGLSGLVGSLRNRRYDGFRMR